MVAKKKIVDDLKKYNKELEMHLPGLNLEHLAGSDAFSNKGEMDDYLALFTNNLMDVKAEMELLRKNLMDNVERVVMKIVSEQQSMFYQKINEHVNTLTINVKNNFASHVERISDELEVVKKEFSKVVVSNSDLATKVDILVADMTKVDIVSDELNLFKEKVSGLLGNGFGKVETKVDIVSNKMDEIMKKQINPPSRVREIVISEPNLANVSKVDKADFVSEQDLKEIEDKAISQVVSNVSMSSSERLLSIDEKLKKLDNLR